jgi:hypothetical protein
MRQGLYFFIPLQKKKNNWEELLRWITAKNGPV